MLNILSRRHSVVSLVAPSLVAFASSVDAKSSNSSKNSKPVSSGGGGGSSCYDSEGNLITCTLSRTEWIVIAVIGGIVVIVIFVSVLHCAIRKRVEGRASKQKEKDTKNADHKVPSEDATLPLYHKKPDGKQPGQMAEIEKPLLSTPTQQYDNQDSDTVSIASSAYNGPLVTHAQPQDYSNQYYYNTHTTVQPRMYAPPPAPSQD